MGETHIDTLRERFTHLVQGNRSVFAYEQEFLQLIRYALELVATEKMRCKRFLRGLRKEIQTYLTAAPPKVFSELAACAKSLQQV